MGEGDWT